jgi:four helix bundle protein
MKDFRNLQVWQKAHQFALKAYHVTQDFPPEQRFEMASQIRRAAVSIPTNIAEGCGFDTDAEFRRFLKIAMGSASEVEYELLYCHSLKWIENGDYQALAKEIVEIKKMLSSLINRLKPNKKS